MKQVNMHQEGLKKNILGQGNQSHDSKNFFQGIVETIREPVLILDEDLKVLYVNPIFFKTFKVQIKETIGKLFFDLGDHQWDIPALRELLEDILKNQTIIKDFQVDHEFSSIGRRIMIVNARQIVTPELNQVLILVVIDDITDRLLTEQAIQDSEERFRRAFETAQDGIVLIEKVTGQIVNSNRAVQELLGYKPAELVNEKIWKLGFMKGFKDYQKDARKLDNFGYIDYYDSSVITKQGDVIPAEISLTNRAKVFQCNIRDITERKQAEEEIFRINELLHVISTNNPDNIIMQDKDLKYIFVHNPKLGLAEQEMLGKSDYDIMPQIADAKKLIEVKTRVLETGKAMSFETSLESRTGEKEFFEGEYIPNIDKNGNIVGLIGYFGNVTKSKLFERALRESEEKYRNLVERANDGIVIIQDGEVRFANQRLAELWGSTVSEIMNTPFTDYIDPNDLEKVVDRYRRRMAGEVISPIYEVALLKKNGVKIIAEVSAGVISFKGKPANLVIVRDINERKEAEQTLKNEQELAQRYLDIAEVMILALDKDGKILLINQKGSRILGYQEKELLGKNWFETCIPTRDRRDIKGLHKKVLAGDLALDKYHKNSVLTKSGERRTVAWNNTILCDENKHPIGTLSSGEDITQRVRTETLLNALNLASVAMSPALTQQEIFISVAKVLDPMDIASALFLLDETGNRLLSSFLSFQPTLLNKIEKLIGVNQKSFSFLIDEVDIYRKVVREKEAVFAENPLEVIRQILPKGVGILASTIVNLMHTQKAIFAPLIVEEQVVGVFSLQSSTLSVDDVPATAAFANQLAGAWSKSELLEELIRTVEGTVRAIAATSEMRDPYTAGHQERVSELATQIAAEMHLSNDQIESIRMAGLVHDLGKIKVPSEILSKPGKLSDLEFNLIKAHPQSGFELLKEIEFPWPLAQIVLQHHEKMDGSGYPNGLKKEEILIEARVLCVADIVEAMSSRRPYRSSLGIEIALNQIKQDRKTLLDPDVVDACLRLFKNGYKIPGQEM